MVRQRTVSHRVPYGTDDDTGNDTDGTWSMRPARSSSAVSSSPSGVRLSLPAFDVPIELGARHAGHTRVLNDGEGGHVAVG